MNYPKERPQLCAALRPLRLCVEKKASALRSGTFKMFKMLHLAKVLRFALALLLTVALVGCGAKDPFTLAPVEGKVTYTDGSLIKADQIVLKFIPQGISSQGKVAPQAAQTRVDVADGSFRDFTTLKYADGVMVGKHKVVAISLRSGALGIEEPTGAIPKDYHELETTPLEVEVSADGDHNLLLEIEKGGS